MLSRIGIPVWVFALPVLHLCACIIIALANLESGVHYLIIADFPFSLLIVMLGWRTDSFLILFAICGTLWWFFLSWLVFTRVWKME